MALHFPLQVNGKHIGYFTAVRIEGDDQPDTVNTYEVEIIDPAGEVYTRCGEVEHRYGDGAWELIRKSIEALMKSA